MREDGGRIRDGTTVSPLQPSTFEVCSIYSTSDGGTDSTPAESRGRVSRHRSSLDECRQPRGHRPEGLVGSESDAIILLQGPALQAELRRHVPLIGFTGQLTSGSRCPPDISGPFVGKRVATFSLFLNLFLNGNWSRDLPADTASGGGREMRPAKRLTLYRLPYQWREDPDLAETGLL